MYFVCEFGLFLVELEKWPLRNYLQCIQSAMHTNEVAWKNSFVHYAPASTVCTL